MKVVSLILVTSFMHIFNKYILGAYHLPVGNKINASPCPCGICVTVMEINSKWYKESHWTRIVQEETAGWGAGVWKTTI